MQQYSYGHNNTKWNQSNKKRKNGHKGVKCLHKACMFHNDNCGLYKTAQPVIDGVFVVNDLCEDTKPHFKLLKLRVGDEKIFSEQ